MSEATDKRSTPRLHAKIPLVAEGRDNVHKPFREETYTLIVNGGGALLALAAELRLHDRFHITNQKSGQGCDCRVAFRSAEAMQGRWSYGVALLGAPDNFWGLDN